MKNKINFSKILNNFLLFWTIRAIVLMVLLSGCKKEFLEDMLPHNGGTVTLNVTVEFTTNPPNAVINKGDTCFVNIEAINFVGFIKVTPNLGCYTEVSNGTYYTSPDTTTTYVFTGTGKDGKIYTKSVTVTIKSEPVDPKIDFLCNPKGLNLNLFEIKDTTTGEYQNANNLFSDQSIFSEKTVYYKNGFYEDFDTSGQLVGNGNWNFFETDSISIGGYHYKVDFLNEEKLVLTTMLYTGNVLNIDARYTYVALKK